MIAKVVTPETTIMLPTLLVMPNVLIDFIKIPVSCAHLVLQNARYVHLRRFVPVVRVLPISYPVPVVLTHVRTELTENLQTKFVIHVQELVILVSEKSLLNVTLV